jgi:L,D-peptidoglycan transpeptidase YkuD (ErfK/YbiS/YcfS/YnhG family)
MLSARLACALGVAGIAGVSAAFGTDGRKIEAAVLSRNQPQIGRSNQLLLVTSARWDAIAAELRCFERRNTGSAWVEVFTVPKAVLGRHGLGWGVGLHGRSAGDGPVKREGDSRAPAGVFRLVEIFGYAPRAHTGIAHFPYRHLTDDVEGVDDPASRHYNRLVTANSVGVKDWNSSEKMRQAGEVYRWGVVVAHNWDQIPNAGSCIFLHIWERPGEPTSGCTAMPAEQMLKVIRWLDERKNPVLVQLPREEYSHFRDAWGLP